MGPDASSRRLWLRRIGWLLALWTASIAVLAIVALFIRMLMQSAGMTT